MRGLENVKSTMARLMFQMLNVAEQHVTSFFISLNILAPIQLIILTLSCVVRVMDSTFDTLY